jgi:hypothetical protein
MATDPPQFPAELTDAARAEIEGLVRAHEQSQFRAVAAGQPGLVGAPTFGGLADVLAGPLVRRIGGLVLDRLEPLVVAAVHSLEPMAIAAIHQVFRQVRAQLGIDVGVGTAPAITTAPE